MRALVQRVANARVSVAGETVGEIGQGLLVYVGVAPSDAERDAVWLAAKVAGLRIFEDENDKLNLGVQDVGGGVLVVSNFTLMASAQKGRRPSFDGAAKGEIAEPLTEAFVRHLAAQGIFVAQGRFGANMLVESQAVGPVNVIVDSPAGAAK